MKIRREQHVKNGNFLVGLLMRLRQHLQFNLNADTRWSKRKLMIRNV